MKIVAAPDSFKECMTAKQAAEAIARGMRRVLPDAEYALVPMADGGEGTTQSLVDATGGRLERRRVQGPLEEETFAAFGVLGGEETAVIEMAAASGMALIPPSERDPMRASTYGTGELIRAALDIGVRKLIVGIGGSATNDGGAGMAQALGARLLDADGQDIPRGGGFLNRLARIDISRMDARLKNVATVAACDVDNPLTGPRGASAVYGPQKGASPEQIKQLDANLARFADIMERDLGVNPSETPGAGAAGGLGAGLLVFLNARLKPGIEIVLEAARFDEALKGASLVITGEGEINAQTKRGKTPMGVAQAAKKRGLPVFALAGSVKAKGEELADIGIDAAFSILSEPMEVDAAIHRGEWLLADAAERLARVLHAIMPAVPERNS